MAVKAIRSQAMKDLDKVGRTIRVRATQKGYYGLRGAIADLREPGQEFDFAVESLEEAGPKGKKGHEIIVVDGERYLLPTWIEDATKPKKEAEEEMLENTESSNDDDVL